jgi:hypothetical protein
LTPETYTCLPKSELLDCLNFRQWREPGVALEKGSMRAMVVQEMYKSEACTLEECQAKTDAELATQCTKDVTFEEIDWCSACLVKLGWRGDTECAGMTRVEQVNTVINLLVKEGKQGTEDELQATKYSTLKTMCNAAEAWRDWCDVCLISKSVRTSTVCTSMTNQEKHNTVVEELRASGATGQTLAELQSASFTTIQGLCTNPDVLSLFQSYLINNGDNPWVCWRDEDCAESPKGQHCRAKPANPDISVCQPHAAVEDADQVWGDINQTIQLEHSLGFHKSTRQLLQKLAGQAANLTKTLRDRAGQRFNNASFHWPHLRAEMGQVMSEHLPSWGLAHVR